MAGFVLLLQLIIAFVYVFVCSFSAAMKLSLADSAFLFEHAATLLYARSHCVCYLLLPIY